MGDKPSSQLSIGCDLVAFVFVSVAAIVVCVQEKLQKLLLLLEHLFGDWEASAVPEELQPLSEQSPIIIPVELLDSPSNMHHQSQLNIEIYIPDRRAPSNHVTPATTPSTMRTFDP